MRAAFRPFRPHFAPAPHSAPSLTVITPKGAKFVSLNMLFDSSWHPALLQSISSCAFGQ